MLKLIISTKSNRYNNIASASEVKDYQYLSFKLVGTLSFEELLSVLAVTTNGQGATFAFDFKNTSYKFTESFASDPSFAQFVASVPEPSEWAMMLLGFSMVAYQVKRKASAVKVG